MRNQRGIITVDFLFSMVLILGLASLMFVLTFTLSVASVTQYVTFAAARNYFPAHIDQASQEKRAKDKYTELINHPVFKPLYTNGWYKVEAQPNIGDHTKIIPGYSDASQGTNKFWGVGTSFVAPVLAFKIPFYGDTTAGADDTGEGFKTYMGSYLGREPTTDECIQFTNARWEKIRNLPVNGGSAYSTGTSNAGYFPMTDDGC